MKRRDFLKASAAGTAAFAMGGLLNASTAYSEQSTTTVPRRPFRDTGIELSIIGFGGMSMRNLDQEKVNRLVEESVEQGINFVDVAPRYGDAEALAGKALEAYRDDIFLATKTRKRTADEAREELNNSLELLRTDHLDLYQMHNLQDPVNDVERAFADGGAMEVLLEAQEAGIVRYLGFSAHTEEAALRAMELHDFDSIMFPVNFVSEIKGDFGPRVVEEASNRNMAIFALKPMVRQRGESGSELRQMFPRIWYEALHTPEEALLALRWTLSQPITSAMPPGDPDLYELAVELAKDFSPITEEERQEVYAMAQEYEPLFSV